MFRSCFPSAIVVPKTFVGGSIRMSSSPAVLDLDGCFSSEEPYHDHGETVLRERLLS